jgi:hypothetical protein
MISRARFVLVLAACAAAAPALSQDAPDDGPAAWSASLRGRVGLDELEAAASDKSAAGGADALARLAARGGLAAPAWLERRVREQGSSATLAALGDSVSAASFSCGDRLYCASDSWSIGDMPTSVRSRLEAQSGREVRGLVFAVPGVTIEALPYEAYAVYLASLFGLNVERMTVLIGHNDPGVCHPDKPGERERFARNVSVALDILGRVARRRGAKLFVGGLMEADALARYADVVPNGASASCGELWASTRRCADLLQRRGEPARVAAARARIAEDDETLRRLSAGRDWVLFSDAFTATSRDGIPDPELNMSRYDCFHPSPEGQARLGRVAWEGGAGAPGIAEFFALAPAARRAAEAAFPRDELSAKLAAEAAAWSREAGGARGPLD